MAKWETTFVEVPVTLGFEGVNARCADMGKKGWEPWHLHEVFKSDVPTLVVLFKRELREEKAGPYDGLPGGDIRNETL